MTVVEEVRRFLELERARGLAHHTVRVYELALAELMASAAARHGGPQDLRELDADDLVAYVAELVERRLAEATIAARLTRLRRLFGHLQRAGVILIDPTAGLRRKHVPASMRAWLTEDEAARLLAAPRTEWRSYEVRNRAILEVLYSSGLRLGELMSLELNDIDLADGYVSVLTSKNGEGRVVPLGKEAANWVRRYLQDVRPRLLERARFRQGQTALVFLSTRGQRMHHNHVNHAFPRYCADAGIQKRVTAHVLRHTFAMHLLKNGASIRHVQAMLGHRGLRATQLYTRLLVSELLEVHRRAHPRGREDAVE